MSAHILSQIVICYMEQELCQYTCISHQYAYVQSALGTVKAALSMSSIDQIVDISILLVIFFTFLS